MRIKNLKYRDLPWDLQRRIDASDPMMQPTKSQNPTVKYILNELRDSERKSLAADAPVSAQRKREVINVIEDYLLENNMDTGKPLQPEL